MTPTDHKIGIARANPLKWCGNAFILYLSIESLGISGPRSIIFVVAEFPSMIDALSVYDLSGWSRKDGGDDGPGGRSRRWKPHLARPRLHLGLGVGPDLVTPEKTAVDAAGNAYVTGSFQGQQVSFGTGAPALSSGNTPNIFVAKYSPTGTLLWVDQFAADETLSSSINLASSWAVDDAGEVFSSTGTFSGRVDFSTNPAVPAFMEATNRAVFTLKLDANGNMIARRQDGSPGMDAGLNIKVDPGGQEIWC